METIITILEFYVLPILIVSTICLILILLLKRILFEFEKPFRESVNDTIENFLIDIILSQPNGKELRKKLLLFKNEIPFRRTWCKKIIIDDMIRFKQNIEGTSSKQITILYKALKLDKYSKKLFKDVRTFHKCEGFYHFQALNYKKGIPFIKPYLKHKDVVIQSTANMTYISLTENYADSFNELKSGVSDLTIIKLMDIIHIKKIKIPANIDEWLETNHNSVTKLALKIMVFYNYTNKAKEIIELVKHPDNELKREAIISVRKLFLSEAKNNLLEIFDTASSEIQFEILETLKVIGDKSLILFLEKQILNLHDTDLRLKAVDCLNSIDENSLNLLAINNFDTQRMVKHVREIYL
mgnify:CR=1 FL=1